jgi:hypothetical protein
VGAVGERQHLAILFSPKVASAIALGRPTLCAWYSDNHSCKGCLDTKGGMIFRHRGILYT